MSDKGDPLAVRGGTVTVSALYTNARTRLTETSIEPEELVDSLGHHTIGYRVPAVDWPGSRVTIKIEFTSGSKTVSTTESAPY